MRAEELKRAKEIIRTTFTLAWMDLIILHLVLLFDTLYTLTIIHGITYFFYILRCIKSYPKNLLPKMTFTVAVLILQILKEAGRRKYKYKINKPLCFVFVFTLCNLIASFYLILKSMSKSM